MTTEEMDAIFQARLEECWKLVEKTKKKKCRCGATYYACAYDILAGRVRCCGECHPFHNALQLVDGRGVEPEELTEFWAWMDLLRQYYDPTHPEYWDCGGRGCVMRKRWLCSFAGFLEDMGPSMPDNAVAYAFGSVE